MTPTNCLNNRDIPKLSNKIKEQCPAGKRKRTPMNRFCNRAFLVNAFLVLSTSTAITDSVLATPQIADELREPQIERAFLRQVTTSNRQLEKQLSSLRETEAQAIRDYIQGAISLIEQPERLSKERLDAIYCAGSDNNLRTDFPRGRTVNDVVRGPFFSCIDKDTGEILSRDSDFLLRSEFRLPGLKFLEFFYYLNLNPPDYRQWHKYRLTDLLSKILQNRNPVELTSSGDVIYEKVKHASNRELLLPKIRITEAEIEQYFERELLQYFSRNPVWDNRYPTVLRSKTVAIPTAIQYRNIAPDVRVANAFSGANTFPEIILAATCIGRCVAIDRSEFSSVIGRYSYPWQILFFADAYPEFLTGRDGYSSLSRAPTILWFAWADMVAGNDADNQLRSTFFYKRQWDLLQITP